MTTGGSGMHIKASDMAKFGYLYINEGRWGNEQIIPCEWIAETSIPHSAGGFPGDTPYGHLFRVTDLDGLSAYIASGYGGQLIYIVPAAEK